MEGKNTVFKTLAASKIVHLSLVTSVAMKIIYELQTTQKNLLGMETT